MADEMAGCLRVHNAGRIPALQPAHAIDAGCYSRGSASSADEARWRITNFARIGLCPVG